MFASQITSYSSISFHFWTSYTLASHLSLFFSPFFFHKQFSLNLFTQDFLEDLWDRIKVLSANGWKLDSGRCLTSWFLYVNSSLIPRLEN